MFVFAVYIIGFVFFICHFTHSHSATNYKNILKNVIVLAKQMENKINNITTEINNIISIIKILKEINVTDTTNAVASMLDTQINTIKKEIRHDFKKSFDLSKKDIIQERNRIESILKNLKK